VHVAPDSHALLSILAGVAAAQAEQVVVELVQSVVVSS
jgi:hypothetical protein